jgi:hypothetical protein
MIRTARSSLSSIEAVRLALPSSRSLIYEPDAIERI